MGNESRERELLRQIQEQATAIAEGSSDIPRRSRKLYGGDGGVL